MTLGYWLFVLMIIPVVAGIICWVKFHTIDIRELGAGVLAALCVIGSVLSIGTCSIKRDTETLSGKVTSAVYIPEWHARWTELETYTVTDSKGKSHTKTRTVTKNRHYPEEWHAETTLGRVGITKGFYNQIAEKHGFYKQLGDRLHYHSGDRYDYISDVKDDPMYCDYPMTQTRSWSNPLKNTKGLHNYREISEKEAQSLGLPNYPKNATFASSRIIGNVPINIWNWDKLNSYLGPVKHVNLILVKLSGGVEQAKQLQEYWQNGKKNDLVICFDGEENKSAQWCYVFGWSKSELVKMNIQSLFLEKPVNDFLLPDLRDIVVAHFEAHQWAKYEDTPVMIPTGWVIAAFILMLISQVALYYFFHENN